MQPLSRNEEKVELVIRDEGSGFDSKKIFGRQYDSDIGHRRGLILIRAGVDEVSYNDIGNEITLTCYAAK